MTARQLLRWWRAPFWVAALATGAKSFVDNPILGSTRLNRAGLHAARVKLAHRLAWSRRRRLADLVPAEWRKQFDRDGFLVVPDVLPSAEFATLRDFVLFSPMDTRIHRQGDTITRRVPVGPALLRQLPELRRLLEGPLWRGLLAYVATNRSKPLYYIQTIVGGALDAPPDPQLELHSDTFYPSLKAWLFLTDVAEDGRPLTYVPGSHRLSPQRLQWERAKSISVSNDGDRLSQRGSFRVSAEELPTLALPQPIRFVVPANTMVVADTYGFHARSDSAHPTLRVEIWAYCRRTPFLPWTGLDLLSLPGIAERRAEWLGRILDWLDRIGLKKQHWMPVGERRPADP